MGEFETILNANTAIKNTLNFLLPRITDNRISGYFKCKSTINEEPVKFLLPKLSLLLPPLKNTSHLFYHTSQIGEFETILNANTALKDALRAAVPNHRVRSGKSGSRPKNRSLRYFVQR